MRSSLSLLQQNFAQLGGAIAVQFGFVNLTSCLLEANAAAVLGGAVFLKPIAGVEQVAILTIEYSFIS